MADARCGNPIGRMDLTTAGKKYAHRKGAGAQLVSMVAAVGTMARPQYWALVVAHVTKALSAPSTILQMEARIAHPGGFLSADCQFRITHRGHSRVQSVRLGVLL